MDTGISSSLIPHEQLVQPINHTRSGGIEDLASFLSIILLVVSVGLGGGVYIYQHILGAQLDSKKQSLDNGRKNLDTNTVNHLIKLSARLSAADTLLTAHVAPTLLFAALSQSTLQTVAFDGITYSADDPTKVRISMGGNAQSVNSIALQSELLAKSPIIKSPIFSGISRQPTGVLFTVNAQINLNEIRYSQLVAGAASTQNAAQQNIPQQTPPNTSPFGTPASGTTQ